jgi:hypothetical protein
MSNGKVISLSILTGLGITGIVVAVIILARRNFHGEDDTPGGRLLAHSRDRKDYRLFVGLPPANPTSWAEVAQVDESSVTLRDSRALKLSEVTAYFVTYPSGNLVDYRCPTDNLPLPAWVKSPAKSVVPDREELTPADLTQGQALVRVTFGKSTSQPGSRHHYSTTLSNVSEKRVRVLKFGGYTKVGKAFALNTITRRFFTAEDFKEWYNQKGEWIEPGKSVADPNNYGSPPVLWAYYCEAEDGTKFLTGGIVE